MKNNLDGKQWAMIIGVVVVLGLISGFIGTSLTGNFISVTDTSGQSRYVYSAAEANRMFFNKTEILTMQPLTENCYRAYIDLEPREPPYIFRSATCKDVNSSVMYERVSCGSNSIPIKINETSRYHSYGGQDYINLPYKIIYGCINPHTNAYSLPSGVYALCCKQDRAGLKFNN